ncbi:MAG: type 1 glutamine amidotransferase [Acidimicrobiia bacterium]
MRIGLLVVGHVDETSRGVAGDYPELFGALLTDHGVDLVEYDIAAGHLPDTVAECDGWLCSPSRSSVYDDLAWISSAEELLRDVIAAEQPYVGICFGHQLLARALGATVERYPGGWQVGAQTYELLHHQPWMSPPRLQVTLIASHQDQVTTLPARAELLARGVSGESRIAGFTVGERAWTLQAHPEFVAPLADHLLSRRVELIGAERVNAARASLTTPLDREIVGAWIARFFATA